MTNPLLNGSMILVTGSTGFLGKHLVKRLAAEGRELRCLARPSSLRRVLEWLGVEVALGDVTDLSSLEKVMGGIKSVVHLAGILEEEEREGTENLVKSCQQHGVERILYVSAMGADPHASSAYHRAKWEAEEQIRQSGLVYTILRSSVIFGEGDTFVNLFLSALKRLFLVPIPAGKEMTFQPLYIDDMIDCLIQSLDDTHTEGESIEIGGPQFLTLAETIKIVAEFLGVRRRLVRTPPSLLHLAATLAERFDLNLPFISPEICSIFHQPRPCDLTKFKTIFPLQLTLFREGLKRYL
ncbi:MAG: NAD(P)H-binding protein [Candidatus Tectomicrobia bacterium]|nr:NAD(P)H-binding protein [Candidatus Tectomicrobia bacterium]